MNGKLLKDLDIKYKDIFTHSLLTYTHHTHGYYLSLITVKRPQNTEKFVQLPSNYYHFQKWAAFDKSYILFEYSSSNIIWQATPLTSHLIRLLRQDMDINHGKELGMGALG